MLAALAAARAHCCALCPNLVPRSMASATEAEELAALNAAMLQSDMVSIARLTRAATSAAVSDAGCCAFVELLVEGHSPTSEETQHAVEALLVALHAHPTSADVQRHGCRGLGEFCEASGEALALAGAGGAVEAIVTAMQMHAETAGVLGVACFALAQLICRSSERCFRAHSAGALDAILSAMRICSTNLGVQNCGCMALANLCAIVCEARDEAAALGAAAVIYQRDEGISGLQQGAGECMLCVCLRACC